MEEEKYIYSLFRRPSIDISSFSSRLSDEIIISFVVEKPAEI
jgi:hypothetical protein